MTDPLRLHYAPDNASLCVRLALETLQAPYDAILVDRRQQAQKSPAFLALNPNGLIPVLETPHGPMFETGATLLWLADTHDGLMPPVNDPSRAHAVQWLFWLANTLHPTLRMLFYPANYSPTAPEVLRSAARIRLSAHLDLLETADQTGWLEATKPSAMACYLAPMLRWPALYGGSTDWYDLRCWPRLFAFAQRFEAMPATTRSAAAEGLGPTPFSDPKPCNPPQGSAT